MRWVKDDHGLILPCVTFDKLTHGCVDQTNIASVKQRGRLRGRPCDLMKRRIAGLTTVVEQTESGRGKRVYCVHLESSFCPVADYPAMPLHNCAISLTRPMFSGSNSCLNKRAYQKLKEAGYRKLKDATYQKIKEVDYRRLKESAYQMVGPKRRFGVRLCCNAARECSTMAARCTTGPFH